MPTWSSRILPRPPSPSSTNSHRKPTGSTNRTLELDRSAALAVNYNVPILPGPSSSEAPARRPHRRSLSQPFPSLKAFATATTTNPRIRGGKKVTKRDFLDSDDDDDDDFVNDDAIRYISDPKSQTAEDVVNGKCLTCFSTMSWPRDTKVFRCSICLMVNDLEPCIVDGDDHHRGGDRSQPPKPPLRDGYLEPRLPATPLSIEKTKKLVDSCLRDFLRRRLNDHQRQGESDLKHAHDKRPQRENPWDPQAQNTPERRAQKQYNEKHLSPASGRRNDHTTRLRSSSDTPVIRRNEPSPRGQSRSPRRTNTDISEPKHLNGTRSWIFRPLEEYIIKSFTGCDCLNNSFLTPGSSRRTVSETYSPRPRPDISAPVVTSPVTSPDGQDFELDPKMLLLGDIAENSSWWMGGRPHRHEARDASAPSRPAPQSTRSRVNPKSPRIDWEAVAEWYKVVLNVGESWRDVWSALVASRISHNHTQPDLTMDLKALDREIAESRVHTQRTLLKATENLLKRPRRPLHRLEAARFLLIVLANPQLTPGRIQRVAHTVSPAGTNPENNNSMPNFSRLPGTSDARKPTDSHRPKPRGLVDHSGIVKRTLGLLANLPDSCHHYLVSWFARFSESQYERLVDLVGRFLTHRLTRQHGRQRSGPVPPVNGLVPTLPGSIEDSHVQLHAVLSGHSPEQNIDASSKWKVYADDWQIRAAARVMALLFKANNVHVTRRWPDTGENTPFIRRRGRSTLPLNYFYNTLLDYSDLVSDFEAWEARTTKFAFCQYPFLLSISAKSRILEHDARRQMSIKAREAFLDSILRQKDVSQYLNLKVRRDCLVEDSLRGVSEVIGGGQEEIKKSLRIEFVGEEGVDAGGLRKEWFLLLVREVFDPNHGLFVYDEESHFCYFNPFCFESSEQFFLVGVLLGLAMYNSTILDVALPPFAFKRLLAAAPPTNMAASSAPKQPHACTLEDLAEYRPSLARGLQVLLDYDGDVQETFCYDFVARVDRYGQHIETPLCPGGEKRPVTNANRQQFVNLYVHYLLDTAVQRQFEPFKRGFFTVCNGNALSLFRPEEIELMVRGSEEQLDVPTLRAVATYENWPSSSARDPAEAEPVLTWFWETFSQSNPSDQRRLLSFVTGSDRIPATGAASLSIRLACLGEDSSRYPIAHTCFNKLGLFQYSSKQKFEEKLWGAVFNSEGFGLK